MYGGTFARSYSPGHIRCRLKHFLYFSGFEGVPRITHARPICATNGHIHEALLHVLEDAQATELDKTSTGPQAPIAAMADETPFTVSVSQLADDSQQIDLIEGILPTTSYRELKERVCKELDLHDFETVLCSGDRAFEFDDEGKSVKEP